MSDVELKAPKGQFRVVSVETVHGPLEDYLVGDFPTAEEAFAKADKVADKFDPAYVYDDKGQLLHRAGSRS
jgi:hypothetical protein